MMKKIIIIIVSTLFVVLIMERCEKKGENSKYDVYENHDISVCGVDDPLQNIEWLKTYCDDVKKEQTASSVYIDLYKVIDTDENLFQINISYSDFEYSPVLYSVYWRNCSGKLITNFQSGMPPMPGSVEDFMRDKEFVIELFHFVKQ